MTKQYTMYDVGSSYLTSCGVEAPDGDCFENMTECCKELNRLLKENEQLRKELQTVVSDASSYLLKIQEIEKENEQLKQLLNEAEDIILCQTTPHYQRQWENIKKNIDGDVE